MFLTNHNRPHPLHADAVFAGEFAQAFARGMTFFNEKIAFARGQFCAKIVLQIRNEQQGSLRQRNVRGLHGLLC